MTAQIICCPSISAAQAEHLCRVNGLRMDRTSSGNFTLSSTALIASPDAWTPSLVPPGAGAAAGPFEPLEAA